MRAVTMDGLLWGSGKLGRMAGASQMQMCDHKHLQHCADDNSINMKAPLLVALNMFGP